MRALQRLRVSYKALKGLIRLLRGLSGPSAPCKALNILEGALNGVPSMPWPLWEDLGSSAYLKVFGSSSGASRELQPPLLPIGFIGLPRAL